MEKFMVLAAVLVIGVLALSGMYSDATGFAMLQRGMRSCACTLERFDYYGNPIGEQVQIIRVKTSGATDFCQNRCEAMFGTVKGHRAVTGEPITDYPVSLKQPVQMPASFRR